MLPKKHLTKEQALQKIKHFCAYQERCHSEVRGRLYSLGLRKSETEELVANLIENDYLNEERFANSFSTGKFKIKHWGRKKIGYELQQKGISSFLVKLALRQLNEEEYQQTLRKLAKAKWQSLAEEHPITRQGKTTGYLLQKGFEPALIQAVISDIRTGNENL